MPRAFSRAVTSPMLHEFPKVQKMFQVQLRSRCCVTGKGKYFICEKIGRIGVFEKTEKNLQEVSSFFFTKLVESFV